MAESTRYPLSPAAACKHLPSGGIAALGRKGLTAAGQVVRGAFTKAEAVAPKLSVGCA